MSSNLEEIKQTIKRLSQRKDDITTESEGIINELTTPPKPGVEPMGVNSPLTDPMGYPRNDIDVLRARTLRGRLATLKTDHNSIIGQLEVLLGRLAILENTSLAESKQAELVERQKPKPKPKYDPVSRKWVVRNWDGTMAGAGGSTPRSFDSLAEVVTSRELGEQRTVHRAGRSTKPFALVRSVADGSPAEQANLRAGDLVLAFGPLVTWASQEIPRIVQQAAKGNEIVELIVQRRESSISTVLQLEPKSWTGRGLLGCHIVPYVPEK